MDWKLQALVGTPVGNELGIGLRVGLQFSQDITIAFPSKEKGPSHVWKPCGLIGESGQLIRQSHLADAGTDIVDRTEQIAQVSDSRHTGAAPGIGTPFPRER